MKHEKHRSLTPKRRARSTPSRKAVAAEPYQLQSQYHTKLLPDKSTDQLRTQAAKLKACKKDIVYMTIPGEPEAPYSQSSITVGTNLLAGKASIGNGFVRSQRNLSMMDDDGPEDRILGLQQEKGDLIKRLNDSLMELDKLNEEKRKIHDQLLEQIKFVRDLDKAAVGDVDDLNSMVCEDIKLAYKQQQALHKQLDAQLQRADQERQQLLGQIKHLNSSKEWNTRDHQGQTRNFRATSNTVQTLMNEVDQLKQECQAVSREINRQQSLVRQESDPDIIAKERAHDVLTNERNMLIQRTEEMMQREQHATNSLGTENGRIKHLNKHTIKLLCAKSVYNMLTKLVAKSHQKAFQKLWYVTEQQQRETLKLCALHNVFKQIRKRILKECVHSWFVRAFKPRKTQKMIRDLPDFFKRKDRVPLQMNKYKIQSDSCVTDQNRKDGFCRTVVFVTKQWETRMAQSAFQFWHRTTFPNVSAGRRLWHLKSKYNKHQLSEAFHQWCGWNQDRKITIRISSLPVKIACQQLEKRVFIALRQNALSRQLKNRSRLLRAFKNLKVANERSRLLKNLESLSSTVEDESLKSVKQICFSQISYQREIQITSDCQFQLKEIKPEINQLTNHNLELQQIKNLKEKRRAVIALVIQPFSKQLTYIFQKWLKNAISKKSEIEDCIRRFLLKIYKTKLRQTFDRLKIQENRKQKLQDHSKIDQLHQEILTRQNQNYKLGSQVGDEGRRIQELASIHLRRLLESVFDQNLTYWLQKWQKGVTIQKNRVDALKFLVQKVRKSVLQQAMSRYRKGQKFLQQDQYNKQRVQEVQNRLKFRSKKRIFQALQQFSDLSAERTKSLKFLFRSIFRHIMNRGMIQWKLFSRKEQEQSLFKIEKFEVRQMDLIQVEVSSKQDELNRSELVTRRLRGILTLEAKVTLHKWIERFCMGGLQYGFITWRQNSDKLKHRVSVLQSVRRHLVLQQLKGAWHRWQEASANLILNDNSLFMAKVDFQTSEVKSQISRNLLLHQEKVYQIEIDIQPISIQRNEIHKKLLKIFESIVLKKDKYFGEFRMRSIIRKWHEHAQSISKACKALKKGITQLIYQRGFDQIKDHSRKSQQNGLKLKQSFKTYRLYKLNRLRCYFNEWRDSGYNQEMSTTRAILTETKNAIETRSQYVQNTLIHHGSQVNQNNYKITLQHIWDVWHKWAYGQAVKRREAKMFKVEYDGYQAKRALLKFKQRVLVKQKQTQQISMARQKSKLVWGTAAFYLWKDHYFKAKRMARATDQIMSAVKNFQCGIAFKKILWQSQIRHEAGQRCREQSIRVLLKILDRLKSQRLRLGQRSIQQHVRGGQRLAHLLQQYMVFGKTYRFRQCFYRWKFGAEKLYVVDKNENQDGPVNIDCWRQRIKCNVLSEMMQHDGAPDTLINYTLQKSKAQYAQLGDKTITRLMIHNDRNLSLLPYCLDRLRSYARTMKKWRDTLHFCNGITRPNDDEQVFRLFKRWAEQGWKQKSHLERKPFNQLVIRSDHNLTQLTRLSDDVQDHLQALDKFKEQRDCLFQSYMSGQRLALSLAKHNQERTEQRTIRKLSNYGNNLLQNQIGNAIKKNRSSIGELKKKIEIIEEDNHKIAAINDSYRNDAYNYHRSVQVLKLTQQENYNLLTEQQNQAAQIKKLLDENLALTNKLQQARHEASNSLEQTQQLQDQKLSELESLKQAERESTYRRQILTSHLLSSSKYKSIETHHLSFQQITPTPVQQRRDDHSPPLIVTSTSEQRVVNGKSPLRMRNLSGMNNQ